MKCIEQILDESQLAFINKCKKEGKSGCSITINNSQTFIGFYKEYNTELQKKDCDECLILK